MHGCTATTAAFYRISTLFEHKTPINFWIPGGERKPLLFHTFCRYVSGYAQPIIFDEDFSLATCVRLTPMPDTHYRIPVATIYNMPKKLKNTI